MTTMLTREQILGSDDLKRQTVAVPEWGGDVFVRMLTGGERDAFEVSAVDVSACAKPAINAAAMIRAVLGLLNFMGSSRGFVSGEHLTRSQILSK